MPPTDTQPLLGTANGAGELFQVMRDGRPRSRTELSELTGVPRSTVGLRIDLLRAMGLIKKAGAGVSTGGRPPSTFALDPTARVVVGVDIGASHLTVAICDLLGEILTRHSEGVDLAVDPESLLTRVVGKTREMLGDIGRTESDLLAVGIGMAGPVDRLGRLRNYSFRPDWEGFDVGGLVRHHLGVPVIVENDVNLMAVGEQNLAWRDHDDLMFIKVAHGIGSGIISGGRLQRGSGGIAGDIGHVPLTRGAEFACRCGNFGCLWTLASSQAMVRELSGLGHPVTDAAGVIELVQAGNTDAVMVVRQAGRDIGEVLTVCIGVLNPSVVVIGGSMAAAGEHLLAGIREVVYRTCMPLATEHLSIVQSRAGSDAGVLGASRLAVESALSADNVMRLDGA